jgi:Ran GTPase-activating protein (RanGAP) involved in mRNA processing and transport
MLDENILRRLRENDPALTNLELSDLSVSDTRKLAEALKGNKSLISLNLSGNKIGDVGVLEIARALATNTTLKELNLAKNLVGYVGALEIARALATNTTLQRLNLSENLVENEGAAAIAEALEINATLIDIDLLDNPIGELGVIAIAEMLTVNKVLVSVSLSGKPLSGGDEEADLSEADGVEEGVEEVGIEEEDTDVTVISDIVAANLDLALEQNSTLKDLTLRDIPFGGQGVEAIIRIIRQNKLRSLNLGIVNVDTDEDHPGITSAQMTMIAKALRENTTLQELDLSGHPIGENQRGGESNSAGILTLVETLGQNKVLSKLNLCGCEIADDGIRAIASMLLTNTTLTCINLEANGGMASETVQIIADVCKQNHTLTTFKLSPNLFPEVLISSQTQSEPRQLVFGKSIEIVGQALRQNSTLLDMGDMGKNPTIESILERNRCLKTIERYGSWRIGLQSFAAGMHNTLGAESSVRVLDASVAKYIVELSAGVSVSDLAKAIIRCNSDAIRNALANSQASPEVFKSSASHLDIRVSPELRTSALHLAVTVYSQQTDQEHKQQLIATIRELKSHGIDVDEVATMSKEAQDLAKELNCADEGLLNALNSRNLPLTEVPGTMFRVAPQTAPNDTREQHRSKRSGDNDDGNDQAPPPKRLC